MPWNAFVPPRIFESHVQWYRRAAEKGFAPAQFNLALCYELGRGVPGDERQAFRHYLMAAEQGFPAAQFNVGNMYATGRGVPHLRLTDFGIAVPTEPTLGFHVLSVIGPELSDMP